MGGEGPESEILESGWKLPPTSDRHRALEELTAGVRRLLEATVATGAGPEELRAVAAEAGALAERLEASRDDDPWAARSYGTGIGDMARLMGINPAVGACNPSAPEVRLDIAEDASVSGTVRFGLVHVGPPYRAHGGLVASVFDQVLGLAAIAGGSPGMTTGLSVRYRRATPLHEAVRVEATFGGGEGRDSRATGRFLDAEGRVTAEAEATFRQPRPPA